MSPAFTPEPWSLLHSDSNPEDSIIICGGDNDDLAEVFSRERCTVRQSHEEALANARLIVTAPRLYDALVKAAPFVGWASVRGQIVAGVSAVELYDVIDAVLAEVDGTAKLSSGNGQQVSEADRRTGEIVSHLKDCAEAAAYSGSDFNQGVVRGLEIATAQIEGRHYLDAAFGFHVEDAEKSA